MGSPARAERRAPSVRRRAAAALALIAGALTVAVAFVALAKNLLVGVLALVGMALAVALVWQGVLRAGRRRALLFGGGGGVVAAILLGLGVAGLLDELVVVLLGAILTSTAVRTAFGPEGSAGGAWTPVDAPSRPVLLINPRSGDGRAERAGLAGAASDRGIDTVVLAPGGDLPALAERAVAGGADALGMAGGDGSMAIVAHIASAHGLPFVCVPAGTRNHFALDLGVLRDDVVGALDAFTDGVEASVDLAMVGDRPFVNNVSLGVFGDAVQDPGYRGAKLKTLLRSVSSVLGPSSAAPAMRFTDDRGGEHTSAAMLLVSNNPYALQRPLGRSTRPRMDGGRLGVVAIDAHRSDRIWEAPELTVTTPSAAAAAADGEAVTLSTPLSFVIRPQALRVRISARHPGVSPSALLPPTLRSVVPRLARIAASG